MININARFLTQPLSGVQRYAYNVVKRLPTSAVRLFVPSTPRSIYSELALSQINISPNRVLRSHLWEQFVLSSVIPKHELLWSPAGIGPWSVDNHILTITDVASFEHPEWYGKTYSLLYRLLLPQVARRAKKIITISHFSKERISKVIGIPKDRITVTYLGVEEMFGIQNGDKVQATLERYKIHNPFILAVGAISARKNLDRLFKAWEIASRSLSGISLVVVGDVGRSFSNVSKTGQLPENTIHLTNLNDESLVCLYAGALAFIYPSLYEGFGLPILEAMVSGTPVITSNLSSMPEIAGDAALLVDPYNTDAIAFSIIQVVRDKTLREQLIFRGLERAKQFTWEATAESTWKVLSEF